MQLSFVEVQIDYSCKGKYCRDVDFEALPQITTKEIRTINFLRTID